MQPSSLQRASTQQSLAMQELMSMHSPDHSEQNKLNTLTWQNLTFTIGDKDILKGTAGVLEPGQLSAIMGPSGSGKTTLLNVLSGRQRVSGKDKSQGKTQKVKMVGQVTLSGESLVPSDFRHRVAYVYQDSALPPCETPRECLEFSAFLRLPAKVTDKERKSFVDRMLENLNLTECADTIVGSALQKGISGGQQKRVAVGVELISSPKLLFLDEPLSGLDSYNATELVRTLKDLALSGVPVLMTLHQPSSDLFAKLDDLIVLHRGEVCFHGPAKALAAHFRRLGFNFPPNHNPADDVLSLIQKESDETVRDIKDRWLQSESYRRLEGRIDTYSTPCDEEEHRVSSSSESSEEDAGCIQPAPEPRKGGCAPLRALVKRELRAMRRQMALYVQQFVVFKLIIALLYGFFFFRQGVAGDNPNAGPNCLEENFDAGACNRDFINHFSALSLVANTVVIDSMAIPATAYHGERSTFLREAAGGYYNVHTYFLSKTVFEALIALGESIVLAFGTYWLIGFRSGIFNLIGGMWLLAETSSSMMWAVCTVAETREQAAALSVGPWILQFAFSGLLLPIAQIPVFLRWMRWLCPLYYGLGFIASTEFWYLWEGQEDGLPTQGVNMTHAAHEGVVMRREVLEAMEIHHERKWWPYFGMCVVLFFAYRALSIFTLWRNSKYVV